MAITIAVKWKNMRKRFGPDEYYINTNRIRHCLSYKGQLQYELSHERAYNLFRIFMQKEMLLIKFHYYFKAAKKIQTKFRSSIRAKQARILVLIRYWDKILNKITVKSIELADKATKKICQLILKIPNAIKVHVLKQFILAC